MLAAPFSKHQVFSAKDIFARWLSGLGLDLKDFSLKLIRLCAMSEELRAAGLELYLLETPLALSRCLVKALPRHLGSAGWQVKLLLTRCSPTIFHFQPMKSEFGQAPLVP